MALRESLGGHFSLFRALVSKWFSKRLWDAILDCSGLCWTDGSHRGLHRIRLD